MVKSGYFRPSDVTDTAYSSGYPIFNLYIFSLNRVKKNFFLAVDQFFRHKYRLFCMEKQLVCHQRQQLCIETLNVFTAIRAAFECVDEMNG